MKHFEAIEHTADIGARVYGSSLKELFKNSARYLTEMLVNLKAVKPKLIKEFVIESSGYEELLMDFLREILYYYNVEEFIAKNISIKSLSEKKGIFLAKGEKLDRSRHILKNEIKGITFHDFKIEKKKNFYVSRIILDI